MSTDPICDLAQKSLSLEARMALVEEILRNPLRAREAKLAFRLAQPAHSSASKIVQIAENAAAASSKRGVLAWFSASAGVTAAALLVFGQFNVPTQPNHAPVSVAQNTVSDDLMSVGFESSGLVNDERFGASFE